MNRRNLLKGLAAFAILPFGGWRSRAGSADGWVTIQVPEGQLQTEYMGTREIDDHTTGAMTVTLKEFYAYKHSHKGRDYHVHMDRMSPEEVENSKIAMIHRIIKEGYKIIRATHFVRGSYHGFFVVHSHSLV